MPRGRSLTNAAPNRPVRHRSPVTIDMLQDPFPQRQSRLSGPTKMNPSMGDPFGTVSGR